MEFLYDGNLSISHSWLVDPLVQMGILFKHIETAQFIKVYTLVYAHSLETDLCVTFMMLHVPT